MRNYISNNTKYYKASEISRIQNHNNRTSSIDYLLPEQYQLNKNESVLYDQNNNIIPSGPDDAKDIVSVSSGTYEENLRNHSAKSSRTLTDVFNESMNLKTSIQNKKGFYKKGGNELLEMVVSLSEQQAKYYLDNNISLMDGYKAYATRLNEIYGLKPLSIDMHTDEGFIDENGVVKYNIHAHLVFHNFDFIKEKTILRTLKINDWEFMQDIAALSFQDVGLDFIRGEKKLGKNKDHLERNAFILHKQQAQINDKKSELSFIIKDLDLKKDELKILYTDLGTQKNNVKDLRGTFARTSKEYKNLTTTFKTLQQNEQQARAEHRELVSQIKDKKSQLDTIDIEVSDKDIWLKDTKRELKKFILDNTIKNKASKYEIQDINHFYDEIVDLVEYVSNLDIKLQELDTLNNKLSLSEETLQIRTDEYLKYKKLYDATKQKLDDKINRVNTLNDTVYDRDKTISDTKLYVEKLEQIVKDLGCDDISSYLNILDGNDKKYMDR